MLFSGRRKAEQMDGLLTDSKYLPEHRKRGDCCSCHCCVLPAPPSEDCVQLGDQTRLSSWQIIWLSRFCADVVLGIGLLFSATDRYQTVNLASPVPFAFLPVLVCAFSADFSMCKHNTHRDERKDSPLVGRWVGPAVASLSNQQVCYFSQSSWQPFQ